MKKKRLYDLVRLHVSMPHDLRTKLSELQVVTMATSASSVMVKALLLYEMLVMEHQNGCKLYIKRPDGRSVTRKIIA